MKGKTLLFVFLLVTALVLNGCAHFYQDLKDLGQEDEFQISSKFEIVDGKTKVLIGFLEKPGKAELDQVKGLGGEITRTFEIVPAIAANIPSVAIEKLAQNPRIRYVEPDVEFFALNQTVPWGIDRVFGEETYAFATWGITKGDGVAVAILDTGIDENHQDLPALLGGVTTVDNTHWGSDGSGHGTHVAGTVAALDNSLGVVGVGPKIGLYAVKVLSDSGSGSAASVVAGIDWVVKNDKVSILNMSLGSSTHSQTLKDACDVAYSKGHLIIASAGNSGNPAGRGDNVGYPAAYESVIAVAASTDNDRRASYSSTGPAVELIAPGSGILSTIPSNGYGTKSGTSMASPHVAGVVALAWVANPALTNVELREVLQKTAENLGLSSNHQGYGLVRADLAVRVEIVDDPGDATYTLSGTVIDLDEKILPGATVKIDDKLCSTSGNNGYYEISGVPEGTYNITASKDGYYSVTKENIEINMDTTVDFQLKMIVEENGDNGNENPEIVEVKITSTSNPAWARVTVEWSVSSDIGLASVKSEMFHGGSVVDSKTSQISGNQASGTHELRNRGGQGEEYTIKVTVTDIKGNVASQENKINL